MSVDTQMKTSLLLSTAILIATIILCLVPPTFSGATVLIPNRLLYDISSKASSNPSKEKIQEWLLLIQDFLQCGISFVFSNRLATIVANRVNYVKRRAKGATGGAGKMKFLQQQWKLALLDSEFTRDPLQAMQVSSSARPTRTIQRKKPRDKPYYKRHERRLRNQQKENCSDLLSEFFSNDGLAPTKLFVKKGEASSKQIDIIVESDAQQTDLDSSQEQLILMMLYVKDKHHISGQAYHEIATLCKEIPRHYRIKQKITELNSLWNLLPTPEGTCGVQQKLEERLRLCLERMIDHTVDSALFKEDIVRVKLTGDGTQLGKHLHVVNFAFTILEEGSKSHAPSGNHCIAILKEAENYESLKKGLQDIVKDVEKLTSITVHGRRLKIVYYLGGDWKFLATVTGVGAATSNFACIWCKCPSLERFDCSKQWSILDREKGARTIEENEALAKSRRKEKYSVTHEPLFRTIPLERVVVDNLHMFLRVADTLIDLLLIELRRLDCIDKSMKVKSLAALNYLRVYESTLKMLGINGFEFWIGKESRKLKWRTLTGPEKLLLFSKLNIPETFPQVPNCVPVQELWNGLLSINRLLSTKPEEVTEIVISKFQADSKKFLESFVAVYPAKFVTPYMHCMAQHVTQFFRVHGSILPFTQQGLEKYNDLMTKDYFRSSSHRGVECLQQILQKHNRLEHLEYLGAKRVQGSVHCSVCGAEGHNKRSCHVQLHSET